MALLDPAIRRSTAWHTGLAGVATLLIVSVPVAAVQLASPPSAPPTRDALVARALAGNLIDLAGDGEIGGITAMLDAGADVNATVRGDGSPLIAAAGDGHLEAVAAAARPRRQHQPRGSGRWQCAHCRGRRRSSRRRQVAPRSRRRREPGG